LCGRIGRTVVMILAPLDYVAGIEEDRA
jgi:hypothetical protein